MTTLTTYPISSPPAKIQRAAARPTRALRFAFHPLFAIRYSRFRPAPPRRSCVPAFPRSRLLAAVCSLAVATVTLAQPAASQSAAPRPFQPGIEIDWTAHSVRVTGRIALREGPLEYFACYPGKEHESIVRLDGSATHLAMALGLVGLTPGHPPRLDESGQQREPPAGDLVEIEVEWEGQGGPHRVPAFSWLREIEYDRPPFERPWVFAGSLVRDGTLVADASGSGVAIVDQPDALLALARGRTSRDAELWLDAYTDRIPPVDTPVTLEFRRAQPHPHEIAIDWRGLATIDGRYAAPADVAEAIDNARRLDPDFVQKIDGRTRLRADADRFRAALQAAGAPAGSYEFRNMHAESSETQPSENSP